MKKMISLLAAALLATVFAAGCAKTECTDATTEKQCLGEEKFFGEPKNANLKGKVCKWETDKCVEDKKSTAEAKCVKTDISKLTVKDDKEKACADALDDVQKKLILCKLKDDGSKCEPQAL